MPTLLTFFIFPFCCEANQGGHISEFLTNNVHVSDEWNAEFWGRGTRLILRAPHSFRGRCGPENLKDYCVERHFPHSASARMHGHMTSRKRVKINLHH